MYSEEFLNKLTDVVDPKRQLSDESFIKLVEEKFKSTNTDRPKSAPDIDEIASMIERLQSVRKSCCGALFVPVNDNVDAVIAQLRAWMR